MSRFQNSKIYIITSKRTHEFYVGSTTKTLEKRFERHTYRATHYESRFHNTRSYQVFRAIGMEHWTITLLEEVRCKCLNELTLCEQWWIDKLKPTMNSKKANTRLTEKEYKRQWALANPSKRRASVRKCATKMLNTKVKCSKCSSVLSKMSILRHQKRNCRGK